MALDPICDEGELLTLLDAVRETGRFLDHEGAIIAGGLPDPSAGLQGLAYEGRPLEPLELRGLATVVRAIGEVASTLRRLHADDYPFLTGVGSGLPDLRDESVDILRAVASDGSIADEASDELRRIRRRRLRAGERLRNMLESYLRRPDAGSVIRDDFITQRNGRFVIPVRTDTPHPVKGIVQGTQTLHIVPGIPLPGRVPQQRGRRSAVSG